MTADQDDYALSLSQDELHGLATLIHDECKCVPQNNGGGDCDWCRVYYATTDLAEEITACVTDLRAQVDSNRRALGQEICEGLTVRGHQAPKDTASSDIIGAVFLVIDRQKNEIERDNMLLRIRGRLLDELPDCAMHGSGCVPHAVDFIKNLIGAVTRPACTDKGNLSAQFGSLYKFMQHAQVGTHCTDTAGTWETWAHELQRRFGEIHADLEGGN